MSGKKERVYHMTDSVTIPPMVWVMIDKVFLLRNMPASKKARPGIIPSTRTVEISTHVVSPVSMHDGAVVAGGTDVFMMGK